jgi:hypothetical protein
VVPRRIGVFSPLAGLQKRLLCRYLRDFWNLGKFHGTLPQLLPQWRTMLRNK